MSSRREAREQARARRIQAELSMFQRTTTETEDRLSVVAERDHYRTALEQIAGHFLPDDRTYGGPIATLDMIQREVTDALNLKGKQ